MEQIKGLLQNIANYKNDIDQEVDGSRNEKLGDDEYYAYNENDVRWRHFGCRYYGAENDKLEITALDLGSLERVKCRKASREKAVNNTIKKNMEHLKRVMGSEQHKQADHPIIV